jgi:hypothetical protein
MRQLAVPLARRRRAREPISPYINNSLEGRHWSRVGSWPPFHRFLAILHFQRFVPTWVPWEPELPC